MLIKNNLFRKIYVSSNIILFNIDGILGLIY